MVRATIPAKDPKATKGALLVYEGDIHMMHGEGQARLSMAPMAAWNATVDCSAYTRVTS